VASVSAVIVSYADAAATAAAVASLRAQSVPPQEVLVVDNHPGHPAAATPGARVLCSERNLGFAGGAALGARATSGEWILFLNPDAAAEPACLEHLLAAAHERAGVVGAQVLLPDGRVNAGDNPVHLSGVAWSGGLGSPREDGPPRAAASVSGAAMLVRRAALEDAGGISERFFLYHEDVDLCWRMLLCGWDVVFAPRAAVVHDYAFDKGAEKWFFLERNRAWTVLTCYAARTLALLAPLLLAGEAAIALRARREGWWPQKRAAWAAVARERGALRARRAEVQGRRRVADREILARMAATIDTPLVEAPAGRLADPALRAYRALVLALA
jgi:GT2 family glycosyltransferase